MAETQVPAGIARPNLAVRIGTAAAYAVVVLGALLVGELFPERYEALATGVVFGVMAAVAAAEFYAMERADAKLPNELVGVACAAAMPLSAALWGMSGLTSVVTVLIAASLVWHTMFLRARTADTAITVFGAVYTGFMLGYLPLVRQLESGLVISLALIISVWANDVFAYFFGSLMGRHRLAPKISPKKSWEGFIAGIIGTVAVWALLPFCPASGLSTPQALLAGLAVAISATIGDLTESRMKREAGVKDSGHSLPGHGGFLDRLDSLILASLVAYWVLNWTGVR